MKNDREVRYEIWILCLFRSYGGFKEDGVLFCILDVYLEFSVKDVEVVGEGLKSLGRIRVGSRWGM